MLLRTLVLKGSSLPLVERTVRKSFLFRPVVRRFIAGDTLAQAIKASEGLVERGIKVTLDYLGENVGNEQEAEKAKQEYIAMLDAVANSPCGAQTMSRTEQDDLLHPGQIESTNISIKLTQCGLDQSDELAERNLREVLDAAKRHQTFVRVDMEGSPYTQRTLDILFRVWPEFNNTGTVLQSALRRTPLDVEEIVKRQIRCRLVKGAYLEPANIAYAEKAKVDSAYVACAKKLLDEGFYPAIATQDEHIIDELLKHVKDNQIEKSRFEFQMLYGIRRDLQDRLAAEGYNVRVYIPFGDKWYPYFMRRLAERPANLLFIARAFFKG